MKGASVLVGFMIAMLHAGQAGAADDVKAGANWGLELRLGPYSPQWGHAPILQDGQAVGNEHQYFKKFFTKSRPLMVSLEVERYIPIPIFGLLGVFARGGQWKTSAKTQVCFDGTGTAVGCSAAAIVTGGSSPGNGTVGLTIYPVAAGLVYRFDVFQQKWAVPLVPYGKAAFDYFYWSANVNGKSASWSSGGTAKGYAIGFEAAAGLALNLDWIDPRGANKNAVFLDSNLFAEYQRIWADSFGQAHSADMSGTQWMFGLSFDFK